MTEVVFSYGGEHHAKGIVNGLRWQASLVTDREGRFEGTHRAAGCVLISFSRGVCGGGTRV